MNGGMLCFGSITLSHSTNRGGSVGFRDDVGIVPYERTGGAIHSTGHGCGPTWRDDVGIVPYKRDGVRSVQRSGAVPWENFFRGHYLFLVVIRYTI